MNLLSCAFYLVHTFISACPNAVAPGRALNHFYFLVSSEIERILEKCDTMVLPDEIDQEIQEYIKWQLT